MAALVFVTSTVRTTLFAQLPWLVTQCSRGPAPMLYHPHRPQRATRAPCANIQFPPPTSSSSPTSLDGIDEDQSFFAGGPAADADEATVIAFNQSLFPDDDAFSALKNTVEITLPLPLGAIFDELPDGRVFVDELIADGNAAASDGLREGDVVVAISIPHGESLVGLSGENALETLTTHVETRTGDTFSLAVRRGGDIGAMRKTVHDSELEREDVKSMFALGEKVDFNWFPSASGPSEQEMLEEAGKTAYDPELLRAQGFDMDVDVEYEPPSQEATRLELRAGQVDPALQDEVSRWRDLFEKGEQSEEYNA